MPLTQLDPKAALVIIDLQKGVTGMQTVHPVGEVVARSARLARAFRERGLPVVLVNVVGLAPGRTDAPRFRMELPADWTDLAPELEAQPSDLRISKQRVGAFIGTSLDADLRARGVTQILLTGISTSAGVEATGRSAYDAGYHVVYVIDAMTDRDADAHQHCVDRTFPRFGETETTERVLGRLTA